MADNNMMNISSAPLETVISAKTKFKGRIVTDKPVTVDGTFEGEIKSTSTVFVSEYGVIDAKIECQSIKILGKGGGSVTSVNAVELGPNGEYKGDVTTKAVIMADGSKLEGMCKIG